MITRQQKQKWLETAEELGMRFVVVVNQERNTEDYSFVDYCTDLRACFTRLQQNRRRGGIHYQPLAVLDVKLPWMPQLASERPWAPAAPQMEG